MTLKQLPQILLAVAIATTVGLGTTGCDGGSQKPESIASPDRVKQIVEMRKIFDEGGGKWDTLPAEKKEQFTKLAGSEAEAKTMWESMAKPGGPAAGPR